VPDHEPGEVVASVDPKVTVTAVDGADAPIVTVVALAEIVRPRLRAATEKRQKILEFDIYKCSPTNKMRFPIIFISS